MTRRSEAIDVFQRRIQELIIEHWDELKPDPADDEDDDDLPEGYYDELIPIAWAMELVVAPLRDAEHSSHVTVVMPGQAGVTTAGVLARGAARWV